MLKQISLTTMIVSIISSLGATERMTLKDIKTPQDVETYYARQMQDPVELDEEFSKPEQNLYKFKSRDGLRIIFMTVPYETNNKNQVAAQDDTSVHQMRFERTAGQEFGQQYFQIATTTDIIATIKVMKERNSDSSIESLISIVANERPNPFALAEGLFLIAERIQTEMRESSETKNTVCIYLDPLDSKDAAGMLRTKISGSKFIKLKHS